MNLYSMLQAMMAWVGAYMRALQTGMIPFQHVQGRQVPVAGAGQVGQAGRRREDMLEVGAPQGPVPKAPRPLAAPRPPARCRSSGQRLSSPPPPSNSCSTLPHLATLW